MISIPFASGSARVRRWVEREPALATGALLVAVADLALVVVHVVAVARAVDSPVLRLDVDRSYAELFEYLKVLWCLVLLALTAARTRGIGPLAWAPLLTLLLLDNGWTLHERFGNLATEHLGVPHDVGELLFVAFAYPLTLLPVVIARVHAPAQRRTLHRRLAIGVGILLAFGVGGDALHGLAIAGGIEAEGLQRAAAILEDGGELVAFSLLLLTCAATLAATRTDREDSAATLGPAAREPAVGG